MEWYFKMDDSTAGPYNNYEMEKLLNDGRIKIDTLVRSNESSEWCKLYETVLYPEPKTVPVRRSGNPKTKPRSSFSLMRVFAALALLSLLCMTPFILEVAVANIGWIILAVIVAVIAGIVGGVVVSAMNGDRS